MTPNRLRTLLDAGQSIWLDYIDRRILFDGSLLQRIREDGLGGMTSNPSIFEKALAESTAYDAQIESASDNARTAWELFELIETEDVRTACDIFSGVYHDTKAADGYVSIEVSPGVANDASATIEEAHRLWSTVDRPNVMVKVPGTAEGAVAVRQLIADGINVNITLLFAIAAHDRVIEAFLAGLEDRLSAGQPIDHLASVASFFVSRVDTAVDKRLDASRSPEAAALKGRAAVANAKLAYRLFAERFSGARWEKLAARGARVQRPLWASTSTKNPAYRDVVYVESLIGPHTVNTMPPATIEAFRDHGQCARTVDRDYDVAEQVIARLAQLGIDFDAVTDQLLVEGLASFQKSFDTLIAGLERKTESLGWTLAPSRD
jgi:transaldolase